MQSTCLLYLFYGFSVIQAPTLSATEVEDKVIESRKILNSGHLVLLVTQESTKLVSRIEFAFDGPLQRMDIIDPPGSFHVPGSSLKSDYSQVRKHILTLDEFITHTSEERRNSEKFVASIVDLKKAKEQTENALNGNSYMSYQSMIDPRVIGAVPYGFGKWWIAHYESLFRLPNRTDINVVTESVDSTQMLKETFKCPSGALFSMWVDPESGFNPVRMTLESNVGKKNQYIDEMLAELSKYPSGSDDVWFPSKVQTHRIHNGKKLSSFTINIESAKFNVPIPPETFTLAGMDLPVGTIVDQGRSTKEPSSKIGRYGKWDGSKISSLTKDDFNLHKKKKPPENLKRFEGNNSRIFLIIALNLLVIGIFLIIRFFRKQRLN